MSARSRTKTPPPPEKLLQGGRQSRESQRVRGSQQSGENRRSRGSALFRGRRGKKRLYIAVSALLFALVLVLCLVRQGREYPAWDVGPALVTQAEQPQVQAGQAPGSHGTGSQDSVSQGPSALTEPQTPSGLIASQAPSRPIALADPASIPPYAGEDQVVLNEGRPNFTEADLREITGEHFSPLDSLGRCGSAWALLGRELLPSSQREELLDLKPSGWHTVKYPDLIPDRFLFNRCHLIAFCLTGQNKNPLNLITGTRHLNADLMLPLETRTVRYLESGGNHVLYRVTPLFLKDELVARGVEMEAFSVEDAGRGVCFHVFLYNVQPGIEINYRTGESRRAQ